MVRALFPIVLLVLLTSCHAGRWAQVDTVREESRVLVEVERWGGGSDEGSTGFAHPVDVDAASLSRALSELSYQPSRRAEPSGLVVAAPLAEELASAIADGLADAEDDSRVRFAVLNPDTKILTVSRLTRGVAFVKPPGVLHLVFDLVNDADDGVEFGSWANPVKRALSAVYVLPPPGAELYVQDGDTRETWVTLALPDAPAAATSSSGEATFESVRAEFQREAVSLFSEASSSPTNLQTELAKLADETFGAHPELMRAEAEKRFRSLPKFSAAKLSAYVEHKLLGPFPRFPDETGGEWLVFGWDPLQIAEWAKKMALSRQLGTEEYGLRSLLGVSCPDEVYQLDRGDFPDLVVDSLGEVFVVQVEVTEVGVCRPVSVRWMKKS